MTVFGDEYDFSADEINQSIVSVFEKQVACRPNNSAVITKKRNISYQELDAESDKFASIFINNSIKSQPICLLYEHDYQMIVALMSVLKSGNTYVPLDPTHPPERSEFILKDCGSTIILTNDLNLSLAEKLANDIGKNIEIINIDSFDTDKILNINKASVSPTAFAYYLYTSGSTGKPKGVIQNHRNVLHFIRIYSKNLKINPTDRLTLFSTYGFDAAVMDIFGALLNGATLYPYNVKEAGAIENIPEWIDTNNITIFHCVPTLYRHFIANVSQRELLNSVRLVVMGGEPVLINDVESYRRCFSDECVFVNGLGPTESTVTLQYFIDKNTLPKQATVPVGFPVADTAIYLLDDRNREVEDGEVGELVYKSEYLAIGYLNQDEKTDSVFITDPVTKVGRVFKSGDLGKRTNGGPIEFIGRNDFQIKIRGYRVELNEIESAMDRLSLVAKSVVMPFKALDKDPQIIAYFTTHDDTLLGADVVKKSLARTLPSYMIPSYYYQLQSMPLTATGKIDRKFIADTFIPNVSQAERIKPRNHVEKKIASIWTKVLRIDDCCVKTEFAQVGGDSLNMTSLVVELQKKFKIDIPLCDIVDLSTIEKQAEYIMTISEKNA